MGGQAQVYLVTGFLGSGKTTFINNLLRQFPPERKLLILENEFGEVGIDGTLLTGEKENLEIREISKGSVFCACVKTDFIKALLEIAQKIRPDVLIIEATGVADPSDLERDLALPIFDGYFELKEQVCIIDAANFLEASKVFASLEKQLKTSSLFIINKVDLVSQDQVVKIKDFIGQRHPHPRFYETTYGKIDVAAVLHLDKPLRQEEILPQAMSEEELEKYIEEEIFANPQASLMPPDILVSASFVWQGSDLKQIEELAKELPAGVVRVKGFLSFDGRTYLFSYVMGQTSVVQYEAPVAQDKVNLLVLIAPPEVMPAVNQLMGKYGLVKLGEWNPAERIKAT